MKFAHMSDVHIGAWRDPQMKDLNLKAFIKSVDMILKEKVDFLLISGDLFNTALPLIDQVKEVVRQLNRLKDATIPVYYVAGSHDFSPSGKTMLDVLEEAGLAINVTRGGVEGDKLKLKFTVDKKTGVKITGLLGKKGMLDRHYYEALDQESLEKEPGEKIFLFHTSITELKPKDLEEMDSYSVTFMPKGFNYYAGGHVHIRKTVDIEGYKNVVYPGPIFPCNFAELEKLQYGSFMIVENWKGKLVPVELKPIKMKKFDADGKTPSLVNREMESWLDSQELTDAIVLIRVEGRLVNGKPADIDFSAITENAMKKKAHHVLRNTSKLTSEELEEIKVTLASAEEIERKILKEHAGQIKVSFSETEKAQQLMRTLGQEKDEGEKSSAYEQRILDEADLVMRNE
ncbi:MAG: DNA repair exonuclease [Candidatus Woesearchaeota archaeon]